jgi:hypothetical protein
MKMYKILIPLIFLILLSPVATAQTITIGVMPSEVILDFYKSESYNIQFNFWNDRGSIDATYNLYPEDCLKNIIKDYPKEVLVPKGTTRTENPVKVWITFSRDNTGNKNCSIIVTGKGVGVNESMYQAIIKPSVAIKVIIYQGFSESDYSQPKISQSQGFLSEIVKLPAKIIGAITDKTTDKTGQVETVKKVTTTTTTENQLHKQGEGKFNLLPLALGIGIIGGISILVFYLFYKKPVFFFFVLLVSIFIPSVSATGTNIPVEVNISGIPPPPPPPIEKIVLSVVPVLTATGIVVYLVRALTETEMNYKRWIALGLTIIISIVLIAVLVSVV